MDAVGGELRSLQNRIGAQDQIKLEQYTEVIRDVERRIAKAEEQIDLDMPVIEQPQGVPPEYEDHWNLMFDLQLLAFQADLTRVISFMVGKEQSARTYPQIGVPEAHHPLSHHGNDPALIAQMSKINRYHVDLFSRYVEKLRTTPDVDGTLLDNTVLVYGGGLSNSTGHSPENIPVMLLGGGAGTLQGGRHIHYPDRPTNADLLVTLMDKFGLPVDHIGSSTHKLNIDAINTLSGI
jgi:hypothetical protein